MCFHSQMISIHTLYTCPYHVNMYDFRNPVAKCEPSVCFVICSRGKLYVSRVAFVSSWHWSTSYFCRGAKASCLLFRSKTFLFVAPTNPTFLVYCISYRMLMVICAQHRCWFIQVAWFCWFVPRYYRFSIRYVSVRGKHVFVFSVLCLCRHRK